MKYIHTILIGLALLSSTLLFSCHREHKQSDFVVTIAPLKYIVEEITCHDFSVEILVPAGTSPETFDPTPKQIANIGRAKLIFSTGLIEFENELMARINNGNKVVNLSRGIKLIEGSCSHSHQHHQHGTDPHIWTSPRELKIMATNAYQAIIKQYPDSTKYTSAYNQLIIRLDSLDNRCIQMIDQAQTKAFLIYHPALTYYARAYNIEQIVVEQDGKEPTGKHLSNIIDKSRTLGIKNALYQTEYPKSVIETVAKDIGAKPIEINPLKEDVEQNILNITQIITGIETE